MLGHKSEGAVRISVDHKPEKETEKKRIEDLGGRVFKLFGCWRVNGVLAVCALPLLLSLLPPPPSLTPSQPERLATRSWRRL